MAGRTGRGATRTATRSGRTRSAATARSSCAAPGPRASTARVGPVAIANGRFGNRPHCIYRGFCLQGCKVNAKASPLITHVPDALAHGAEVRADCMVTRIEIDERTGAATGVALRPRRGRPRFQRARMVAVAGYSIETPRLLLNSACRGFPTGSCNDFDQVGRYVMVQGAPQTAGRFDAEIRMYKAPPPEVSTEEFYETDPSKPYRRGFSIQTVSPLPITWAEHVVAQGHWGADLRAVHDRLRALGLPRRAVRVPAATRTTGSPWPTRRTGTACRSPSSPTASATTTGCWCDGRAGRHGEHPARGRAPTRS